MQLDATEAYKRDCHARWLLDNKSRPQIVEWLQKQEKKRPVFAGDMKERLNRERKNIKAKRNGGYRTYPGDEERRA